MKNNPSKLTALIVSLFVASFAHAATTLSTQDYDLYPGDFNHDGKMDLMYVAKDAAMSSGITINDGNGPNLPWQTWPSNYLGIPWYGNQYTVHIGDFNYDGRSDVLLQRNAPGDSYLILAGDHGLEGSIAQTIPSNHLGIGWTADQHKILVGDFNGDGRADLFFQATSPSGTHAVVLAKVYPTTWSQLFLGNQQGLPHQTWTDSSWGAFKWSTKDSNIFIGNFNGGGADLLIQAKPKTVVVNYDIPIPVPVYQPNSFGLALSSAGEVPFQLAGIRQWSRRDYGVDWAPTSSQIVVGYFNAGDLNSSVLLQARYTGQTSFVVRRTTDGNSFESATALSGNIDINAGRVRLLSGFGTQGSGFYAQTTTAAGDSAIVSLQGSTITATSHTLDNALPGLLAVSLAGNMSGSHGVTANGSATYSIPIDLPAGVNGLTPRLAITYSSDGGPGLLGPRWTVSGASSAVTRCRPTMASDGKVGSVSNNPVEEIFCLDGNKLKRIGDTDQYRTELETYSRITRVKVVPTPSAWGWDVLGWDVQRKDGTTWEYRAHNSSSLGMYSWELNAIRDRAGNEITFHYVLNESGTVFVEKIKYGTPSHRHIILLRRDTSVLADKLASSNWFGDVRNWDSYLSAIRIYRDEALTDQVRSYRFDYQLDNSQLARRPVLRAVQQCGLGGTGCVAPIKFTWSDRTPTWQASQTTLSPRSVEGAMPGDFDGDGYEDLFFLEKSSPQYISCPPNYSGPETTCYQEWQEGHVAWGSATGYGASLATVGGQVNIRYVADYGGSSIVWSTSTNTHYAVSDVDGDGRKDLLVGIEGNLWHWTKFSANRSQTSNSTGRAVIGRAVMADVDGDGYDDLVSQVDRYVKVQFHNRDGSAGFESAIGITADLGTSAYTLKEGSGDGRHRHMDMDGDGRNDFLVQWSNGTSRVLYSDGTSLYVGDQGNDLLVNAVPISNNTDSCTDIVAGSSRDQLYISSCRRIDGNSLGTAIQSKPFNPVGDWDGDGFEDGFGGIVGMSGNRWVISTSAGTRIPVSFALPDFIMVSDVNGDGRPDYTTLNASGVLMSYLSTARVEQLTSAVDGFGNTVSFDYRPATAANCYTPAADAPAPSTRLRNLNGQWFVVCGVTVSDGIGGTYTTQYSYANAKVNVQGWGFAGVERRTVTDSRNNLSREETYSQVFPTMGMRTHVVDKQSNGTVINDTSIGYQTKTFSSGYAATYFPYAQTTTVDMYEVQGSRNGAYLSRKTTTVNAMDDYGNATDVINSVVDKDSLLAPINQTYTTQVVQTINNDTTNWCLGRSERTVTTAALPNNTSRVTTLNRSVDKPMCRVTEEITEADVSGTPSALSVKTHYDYDPAACGNVSAITVTGYRSNGTALPPRTNFMSYDATCRFPVTLTDPLGKITTRIYNYALGVPISQTDPNGRLAQWEYDSLGRRVKEIAPDNTFTTLAFSSCNASNGYCGVSDLRLRVETTLRDTAGNALRTSYDYLDGFGRNRIADSPLPLTNTLSHVVSTYDSLGRLVSQTVPYTSAYQGKTVFGYDVANRQTSASLRDAGGAVLRQSSTRYEGQRTVLVDPRGNETQKLTDAGSQLRKVIDPTVSPSAACGSGPVCYDYTFESGGVMRATVTDARNNQFVSRTNRIGFATQSVDPDRGTWNYEYTSFGELTKQTDAKNKVTSFDDYDLLGRQTKRYEVEGETEFVYGTPAQHAYGELKSISSGGYTEIHDYDTLGRRLATHITIPNETAPYDIAYAYQVTTGLLDTVTYPASTGSYPLKVKYDYNQGVQISVRDYTNNVLGTTYWQLSATDATGNATDENLGNGVRVQTGFHPVTGFPTSRQAGTTTATNRQNFAYIWDANGNLDTRSDLNQGDLKEKFYYDALNRLDHSERTYAGSTTTNLTMQYDAIGNITSKSDVGNYTYPPSGPGSVRPHAVTTAGSGVYTYDANGNMITRPGVTIDWYSDDSVKKITQGAVSSEFWYSPLGDRYKQYAVYASGSETTLYIGGLMEKLTLANNSVAYRHYIDAGTNTVIHTRWNSGATQNYYITTDHLGSSSTITDQAGSVVVSESFDAFGKRRGTNWSGAPTATELQAIANATRNGYTGQEHLDNVGLIHMNGRVQDPWLGRFLSADPLIQVPEYSQSFNRYSYAWNSPLNKTDPSGFEVSCELYGLQLVNGNCEPYPKPKESEQAELERIEVTGDLDGCSSNASSCFEGQERDEFLNFLKETRLSRERSERNIAEREELLKPREEPPPVQIPSMGERLFNFADRLTDLYPPKGLRSIILGGIVKKGVEKKLAAEAARAGSKVPLTSLKSSPFGPKVADAIPKNGVPRNWSKSQIEDAATDYRTSIASRKAELSAFDALGGGSPTQRLAHAQRITVEEAFLKSLEKALRDR